MRGRRVTARAELEAVLRGAHTVAVLGAHTDPGRPACYVPDYLQLHGAHILPVNPRLAGQARWGEVFRADLREITGADAPQGIDVLDVFRRAEDLPAHVREILDMPLRPRTVWFQLGIRNDAVAEELLAAGLDVVQDRCMLADHRAWL